MFGEETVNVQTLSPRPRPDRRRRKKPPEPGRCSGRNETPGAASRCFSYAVRWKVAAAFESSGAQIGYQTASARGAAEELHPRRGGDPLAYAGPAPYTGPTPCAVEWPGERHHRHGTISRWLAILPIKRRTDPTSLRRSCAASGPGWAFRP